MDRFEDVLAELRERGLLLQSDPKVLSVCHLILGSPIKGSWWGHPKGRVIWAITERLADHPDVMVLKLVAAKVTYVHRRLWPAVYTVARSNELWQSKGLPSGARAILARLRKVGSVRTDQLPHRKRGWKVATLELETRLLAFSQEVHTESGAHAKQLERWEHWARRLDVKKGKMPVAQAKSQLEQATEKLGASDGMLPWVRANNRR